MEGIFRVKEHEIVIGKNLAEKLNVKPGDKVVAMASSLDGTVGSDIFRVVGIFQSFSSDFDKTSIYISLGNAQEMLGMQNKISEFAVIIKDPEAIQKVDDQLTNKLDDNYEVLTYQELVPLLVMQLGLFKQSMLIMYAIIGLALIFGIANTMLMAVFERINELGVLMAIGMKNSKIFIMIMIEAFFLGVIGTAIGIVAGLIIYYPLAHAGIDLSAFAESLTAFGSGAIIYPVLTMENILNAIFIVPFISVIASVYPAYKAIKLQPMNAIRYI